MRFPRSRPRRGKLLARWSILPRSTPISEADTMAKQNSAPDPVSAAMSAIESALNLTDDDLGANDSPSATAPISPAKPTIAAPVLKPAAPALESTPLLRPSSPLVTSGGEAEPKPTPTLSPAPPANDDRETVGAILQAMSARPAS